MATTNHTQTFMLAVQESFKHWPILRVAKQQGFGGRNADEKEEWLSDSVIQIFHDNDVVHPDELQDFISEALFNEFDTIVEDGSLPSLCLKLCQYYQMCGAEKSEEVLTVLREMAIASASTLNIPVHKVENLSDVEDEDEDEDEKIDTSLPSSNGFNEQSQEETMETDEQSPANGQQPSVDEEGWEVVCRTKKKTK